MSNDSHDPQHSRHAAPDDQAGQPLRRARRDRDPSSRGSQRVTPSDASRLSRRSRDGEGGSASARHAARLEEAARLQKMHEQEVRERLPDETDSDVQRRIQDLDERLTRLQHQLPTGGVHRAGGSHQSARDGLRARRSAEAAERGERDSFNVPGRESVFGKIEPESYETSSIPIVSAENDSEVVEERAFPDSTASEQPMFPGPQELVAEIEEQSDDSAVKVPEPIGQSEPDSNDADGDVSVPGHAGQPDPLHALMSYQAPVGRREEEQSPVRAHLEKKDAELRAELEAVAPQEDALPSWQEAAEMSGIFTPANAPAQDTPAGSSADSTSLPELGEPAVSRETLHPADVNFSHEPVQPAEEFQRGGDAESTPSDGPVWPDRSTPKMHSEHADLPAPAPEPIDQPVTPARPQPGVTPETSKPLPEPSPFPPVPEPSATLPLVEPATLPPAVPQPEEESQDGLGHSDSRRNEFVENTQSPGESFHEMMDHFTGVAPAHGAPPVAARESSAPKDSLDQAAHAFGLTTPAAPAPAVSGHHGLDDSDTPESLTAITDDAASLVGKPPTGDHEVSAPTIPAAPTPPTAESHVAQPQVPESGQPVPLPEESFGEGAEAVGALPQFTVERPVDRSGMPPAEEPAQTWAQPPSNPPVDEYLAPVEPAEPRHDERLEPSALPAAVEQPESKPVESVVPVLPQEHLQGPSTTVWPTVDAVERHTQPSPVLDEHREHEIADEADLQTQAYTLPPPTGAVPQIHMSPPEADTPQSAVDAASSHAQFEPPLGRPASAAAPTGSAGTPAAAASPGTTGPQAPPAPDTPTSATHVWPTLPGGQPPVEPMVGSPAPVEAQPLAPSPFTPPPSPADQMPLTDPTAGEAAHYLGQSVTPEPAYEAPQSPAQGAFAPPPGFSPSPQVTPSEQHTSSPVPEPQVDVQHFASAQPEQLPPMGEAPGSIAGQSPTPQTDLAAPHGAFAPPSPSAFPPPPSTPHAAPESVQAMDGPATSPEHAPDFGSGSGSWTVATDMVPPSGEQPAPPVDPAQTQPVSAVAPMEHGERLAPMASGATDAATWVATGGQEVQGRDATRAEFPAEYVEDGGPKKGTSLVSWIAILIVITLGVAAATYMVVKAAADDTPPTGTSEKVTGESFPASSVIGIAVTSNDGRELLQCAVLGRSDSGPSVMSVPVRSLVNVPGAGFQPLANAPQVGENAVFEATEGVLRLSFTSTVIMTESDFSAMVDRLGGVSIEIDERLSVAGHSIDPGENVSLDGAKAVAALHTDERRDSVSDSSIRFTRMMKDVLHRVARAESGSGQFLQEESADVALKQLAELSSTSTASTLVAPASDIGNGEVSVVRLDRSATLRLSREAFSGAFRAEDPNAARVLLRNSGGTPGLTLSARDKLAGMPGVEVALGGNAHRLGVEKSVVSIPEDSAKYRRLGEDILSRLGLPSSALVVSQQVSHDVDVMVLVGADYS